ncbi:MAG: aminotransferase class I/II-fold pyridoxal phosphate-dependent enzyme [Bacteroidales bacterium]|nr:aminotransferase class I/II-fold pyridoxal phosphate-dependent enzyme [Bacteroidales bacterium]
MIIQPAHRTASVREYYFSRKNRELAQLAKTREGGIVNLGIGAPDQMPPQAALDTLARTVYGKDAHKYQNYTGIPELREAFAGWYKRYYGVELNPVNEIQPLVGSKEGILLISLAYLNKGDKVLVPDPGYPTYNSSAMLAEAKMVTYPLTRENGWRPDLAALRKMDLTGVKMMWVNYPNMPTGAQATPELYQELVDFALEKRILIVNDNPYSFILSDRPLSILAAEGARECCLELNSLSKAHNMSGWRIGMVAGAAEYVAEILKVKSQMDSGQFRPMQLAAVAALSQGPEWYETLNAEYRRRKEAAGRLFDMLGIEWDKDGGSLFIWGYIPEDCALAAEGPGATRGERLSDALLYGCGVFMTPGVVFGEGGSDYIRASLCADVPRLEEAYRRIAGLKK